MANKFLTKNLTVIMMSTTLLLLIAVPLTLSAPTDAAESDMVSDDSFQNMLFTKIFSTTLSPVEISRLANSPQIGNLFTKECIGNTPCGWAIYTPFTRDVTYFMQNTCVCPSDKKCYKTDDDLSVSAYVYRCRTPVKAGASNNPEGPSQS